MPVDTLDAPLDFGRALAPVGAERFFSEYWQRKVLSLELDAISFARIKDAIGPLDIPRLARLARGGTQAWIANEHVAHSVIPVDAGNAADFFAMGATLYFLNVPLESVTGALAAFLGAPPRRIIASLFLTPASGGASCHFDMHENFTVQLTGAKRWNVGEAPLLPGAPQGYVLAQPIPPGLAGLMGPIEENVPRTVDLRLGTLFYIPRGTLHRTGAGQVSWSLNLSYVRTMWSDIVQQALRQRLAGSAQWRGTVTGLGRADPAAQAQNILPALLAELRGLLCDPHAVEQICRDFLDRPDA